MENREMKEIALSLMFHNPQSVPVVQAVLDEFEKQSRIHVNLKVLNWETGHAELTKGAIYSRGPDVSEIGSTWVSDLVAMNALRAFTPHDLNLIGKADEFIPASWQTGQAGDQRMWSIPYTANIYLIHYRKDLLRQAGIDETTAFQSHENIKETVKQLAQSGVEMPIVLTEDRHALLHSMASWIWAAGGDFCSADGKQILFDQPQSLQAIQEYFGLLRYIAPHSLKRLETESSIDLFCQGQSAIHFQGVLTVGLENLMLPHVHENWGVAAFPKPYFIGGTNLVIWQHSPNIESALQLVQYLTSVKSQVQLSLPFRMLPPRLAVMSTPEYLADPMMRNLGDIPRFGRSYPAVKLWGVIEERLISGLVGIRMAMLADPSADLSTLIEQSIVPLARRLNVVLAQ
jgi:multiple sugar transport system substrate-binding protein